MGIPRHTRIILIPDHDQSTREYGITRGMVVFLIILLVLAATLMTLLMVSFAGKHDERQQIADLELELVRAGQAVENMNLLRTELVRMGEIQERLLMMLGVEDGGSASADSLAAWLENTPGSSAEAMRRAAALVLSPVPNRWPAAGFLTNEFKPGNVARGVTPHLGIDIAGSVDTPILAAADGTVARAGTDEFLGNFVEIQHGLGYLTVYGHCSRIAVNKGDRVGGGQVIGYMGKSGQASATHLHFEIWKQGEAVDPRTILKGDPPQS